MRRARRHPLAALAGLAALALAGLGAAAIAGFGGRDLPDGAVAVVGDAIITKADFDREALDTPLEGMGPDDFRGQTYDPPGYSGCIEAKRDRPAPEQHDEPRDETLRQQCREEFERLRDPVMEALIGAEWIRQEARERGIPIGESRLEAMLRDYLKQAGAAQRSEYRRFLGGSGSTRPQLLRDLRDDLLEQELAESVTRRVPKVTDADVEDYYERTRRRFALPERRDLDVVLTSSEQAAGRVRAALEDGAGWGRVARRHSIDETSKRRGGRLRGVAEGSQEEAFDRAIFKAAQGELEGPVRTQFGWYVFEVVKVMPPSSLSLAKARRDIRRLLRERREQRALDAFNERFGSEYEAKTVCLEEFRVSDCGG